MSHNINDNNQKWEESFFIKSVIAGFTLLTPLMNLIIAIANLINGKNVITIFAIIGFVVFCAISIIAFSLRNVQRNSGIKSQKDYDAFISKTSNITHNILHKLRNSIYYVENMYDITDVPYDFELKVTQEVLQLIDSLARELSNIIGCKIRACIKCIDYTDLNEEDITKMNLVTFARSGQDNIIEVMQEHRNPISISKNTDFLEIIQSSKNKRQRQYFYEKNLKEFDKKLRQEGKKYENTNQSWDSDYITTIVCPIRLKRKADVINDSILYYDLIGFLCVDSLDENAFDNEYSNFCFDLLKGLSDILYVYLDKLIEYYNEIKREAEQK